MYETPRIVPHELVHDDSVPHDQIHECNMEEYGDCYDPNAPAKVRDVSSTWTMDTDHDGHKN